jgi:hypothetical protein
MAVWLVTYMQDVLYSVVADFEFVWNFIQADITQTGLVV